MSQETNHDAEVRWDAADTPVSVRFDDPYFAREDGRGETQAVFIAGNGLPGRWQGTSHFTVAELGFGTGLNFLETLVTWRAAPADDGRLTFVSFERYPLSLDDLARALSPWPDLYRLAEPLLAHWPPASNYLGVEFGSVTLDLRIGDANQTVPGWQGLADAWYLDGFSPAKNPDLWSAELLGHVFRHTHPGGTFSTYTSAGWARRNLIGAGFITSKVPGFGRKRDRLSGHRPDAKANQKS